MSWTISYWRCFLLAWRVCSYFEMLPDGTIGQTFWSEELGAQALHLRLGLLGLLQLKLPKPAAARSLLLNQQQQPNAAAPHRTQDSLEDSSHRYTHFGEVDDSGISNTAYEAAAHSDSAGSRLLSITRRRTQHSYERFTVPTVTNEDVILSYTSHHKIEVHATSADTPDNAQPLSHVVHEVKAYTTVAMPKSSDGSTTATHSAARRHGDNRRLDTAWHSNDANFVHLGGPRGSSRRAALDADHTIAVSARLSLQGVTQATTITQAAGVEDAYASARRALRGLRSGSLMPTVSLGEVNAMRHARTLASGENGAYPATPAAERAANHADATVAAWHTAFDKWSHSAHQGIDRSVNQEAMDHALMLLACFHDTREPAAHADALIRCWRHLQSGVEADVDALSPALAQAALQTFEALGGSQAGIVLNRMQVSAAVAVLATTDAAAAHSALADLLQAGMKLQERGHDDAAHALLTEALAATHMLEGVPGPSLVHTVASLAGVTQVDDGPLEHDCRVHDHVMGTVRCQQAVTRSVIVVDCPH